ncbi:hypothetical protein M747DRAFT_320792 [Aspergillus niger ATCC 13496]|uniref:Contig An18c0050, genomic contig n=3 Tax=Aspergillus niger TaxID=5061 RepID=A2RA34_ASPNC|nr:uncharacterized protein An18g01770 [Aspergillus niger]RDH24851.1 hypothetical protein M747DRAFT_320792 [Aspergillus niger ATCC 13496]CAK47249.1 unnamed protein product [Aspergillus niger]
MHHSHPSRTPREEARRYRGKRIGSGEEAAWIKCERQIFLLRPANATFAAKYNLSPAPTNLSSKVFFRLDDCLRADMRSHFGCVTCRQRKVKCNEERPICGPCAKSSRDCVFSDCIFRHYSASDLAGDETGYATQTWVKVPSDLVFLQVKDPFADDEEPTFLLEKHRSVTATPITPASEQEVIARSAHSSALPTGNGVLTAILIRHFKEGPSQWLDCFDTNAYYSIKVPVMVATRPMLKAAACALAAKHLHRMCQGDACRMLQLAHLRNSPLQWAVGGVDLKYESVRLYDEAIRYLKDAIRLEIPNSRRDEMFAVVAILCMYELIDAPSTEWRAHLSALPFLYCGTVDDFSSTSSLPNSLLHISRSVFWSLVRQDCLSAFINETQTRLNLFDLVIWRNFGLNISAHGHLLPPSVSSTTINTPISSSPSPHARVPSHSAWLEEDTLSNALVWIMGKIINFITSGDGINPGDYESPPGQRPCFGTTQEDLLERWKLLEFELTAWYDTLPDSFKPSGRTQLFLSNLDPTHQEPIPTPTENVGDADTIDAISFIIPISTVVRGRTVLRGGCGEAISSGSAATCGERYGMGNRVSGEGVAKAMGGWGVAVWEIVSQTIPTCKEVNPYKPLLSLNLRCIIWIVTVL